jgi:hypothetical protein
MVFVIDAMINLKKKLPIRPFRKKVFLFYIKTLFAKGINLVQTGIPCTKEIKRRSVLFRTGGECLMGSFFKAIYRTLKVFIIFTGCTILFYYGIIWVNQEYQDYHRYDEPEGTAIKVSALGGSDDLSVIDRLILFYLNGE